MVLSNEQLRGYVQRLLLSRMRILCDHGFYGLLLMHMGYAVDLQVETACTNGHQIIFGPEFLDSLSDRELDFVMMHEILHVALRHCSRGRELDQARYNMACDIVVNSNILAENGFDLASITLLHHGQAMHLAPNGQEGAQYTAEQVYAMLPPGKSSRKKGGNAFGSRGTGGKGSGSGWDDHSRWDQQTDADTQQLWDKRVIDAAQAMQVRNASCGRGTIPLFAQRLLQQLRSPQTDWRTVLNEFVQEDVVDYSFTPPDRRFGDSPFFLPDFNCRDVVSVENILFMIDTSGSMSDAMVTAAYSEVKGAIDQFDGKLRGWLGFFDAAVVEPRPFADEEEFRRIRVAGGGGTDFSAVFRYVRKHMAQKPPASIIILTDGYAPFPQQQEAMGIPVLWLLNNPKIDPPWGKVARIVL